MQIIKKNLKGGEVTIKVDGPDDLWYLSQLIATDDLVSGKTERAIKLGSDDDRKQSKVKKQVFLKLKVERVEFHEHTGDLRVAGIVVDGDEDVSHGSFHTFNVEQGIVITIHKEEWPQYQLDKLDEAKGAVKKKILIVVFDREEAIFALLTSKGKEVLSTIKGDVAKKGMDSSEGKSFYAEIIKHILDYEKRLNAEHIVIASPSFWKEYLLKESPDDLKKRLTLASCSEVSESAISEVMQRPELFKVLESDRSSKEVGFMEDLLKAIAKGEACYGLKECEEKINLGSVKELLVAYDYLSKIDNHKQVESLMKLAEQRGAKVSVLGTKEPQKKLLGLGGIAGVLRWKTN